MWGIESMKRSRKRLAEVERLIHIGKEKGYLTYDEVNKHLPADLLSRYQMDDVMSMFGDMDIEIIDSGIKIKYQKQEDTETPEEDSRNEEEDKEQKEMRFPVGTSALNIFTLLRLYELTNELKYLESML